MNPDAIELLIDLLVAYRNREPEGPAAQLAVLACDWRQTTFGS